MKPCRICGESPAADRAKKGDWICRAHSLEYKKKWRDSRRERGLKINGSPSTYSTYSKYMQNPEQKMRNAVRARTRRAVKSGKLVRQNCQTCGAKAEIHHPNYSKPFEVVWLCHKHHGETWRKAEGR